jgi:hypothetical protein
MLVRKDLFLGACGSFNLAEKAVAFFIVRYYLNLHKSGNVVYNEEK